MRGSPQTRFRVLLTAGVALICGVLAAAVVATASQGSGERQGTGTGGGTQTTTGTSTGTSPTPPDRRVDFTAKVRKSQKLGPAVTIVLRCGEVCRVDAGGRLSVTTRGGRGGRTALKARRFKIAPSSTPLGVGQRKTIKLKLPKRGLKVARSAVNRRGRARARIVLEVLDLAGNKATQVDKVTLRRR
jgi:hypothetical protein